LLPVSLWVKARHVSCSYLALVCFVTTCGSSLAESVPGLHWHRATKSTDLGWSESKLQVAQNFSATLDTAAVMRLSSSGHVLVLQQLGL
jgi:hypothetical protein